MNRPSFSASATVLVLCASVLALGARDEARAQCLDRTACAEIRAETAELKPELRAARQKMKQGRRALKALEPGGERWIAKRAQLKRVKKTFKALKRELRALQQDYRHQACSSC